MNKTDYEKELKKVHSTQEAINCYASAVYGENSILNKAVIPDALHKTAAIEDLSPNELLTVLAKLENALNDVNGKYGVSQAHLQYTATYLRSYLRYVCDSIKKSI